MPPWYLNGLTLMKKIVLLLALVLTLPLAQAATAGSPAEGTLSAYPSAVAIDAQQYITKHGFQKKTSAGKGTFYTTVLKLQPADMRPYLDVVKELPRTDEANRLCRQQSIGLRKLLDSAGRRDLELSTSIGYGGPVNGQVACVFFIEHHGKISAAQVYFVKIVPKDKVDEVFTVIVTH